MFAGMYIIVADMSVTAVPKELAGTLKGMNTQEVPAAAQDIVTAIVAEYMDKSQNKEKLQQPQLDKTQDPKKQIMNLLLDSTAVLTKKGNPAETAAFHEWLLIVAQATAEAGREGGFLGIGSVRVSDKEKAALEELKSALG